jgi:hypothetical protein
MPVGGEQRLIRRAVCVRGSMRFRLECEPRFNYGRDRHATALSAGGARLRSPSLTLALGTSVPLRQTAAGVTAEFELRAGETTTFVLTDDDDVRACQGGCRGAPARGHRRVLAELDLPVPLRRAVARDRQPLGPGN